MAPGSAAAMVEAAGTEDSGGAGDGGGGGLHAATPDVASTVSALLQAAHKVEEFKAHIARLEADKAQAEVGGSGAQRCFVVWLLRLSCCLSVWQYELLADCVNSLEPLSDAEACRQIMGYEHCMVAIQAKNGGCGSCCNQM
jgi:hypothetical protein